MDFRLARVLAAGLLAAVIAGCGTVTASSSGGGAHPTASAPRATVASSPATAPACLRPSGDILTLASNGKTYCVRVGERFDLYLRGTVASRWLVPLPSSDVLKPTPNGALSLAAGLTGESFAGARPGKAFITSLRPPCAGSLAQKNEAEPAFPVPRTYPLHACTPQRRFIVTIVVLA